MDKELLEKIYTKFISVLLNGYKTGEVEEGVVWKHSLHSMGPWCSPLTIDILEKEIDDIPEIGPHILKFCNATWGNGYTALTNIGIAPTFGGIKKPVCESFIIDFNEDIYGEKVIVSLDEFRRPEKKFDSVEELKQVIDNDLEAIKKYYNN